MGQQELFRKKVTREEVNSLVDRAADLIRIAVDYKFILVLLFLKRLNDLWKMEKEKVKERLIKEAGLSDKDAEEEAEKGDFYTFEIPKKYLWDEVTKDVRTLPEKLATGISEIAKLNKDLQGVINRVDFLEFARNQENRELLRQLVELFNKYDLGGEEVSPDVLGDAYEHILMRFAPLKAKEGEIYTPREVIKLMVEILDPKPEESVYDPCCGSGGMLILSHLHVAEKYGEEETRRLFLFGQERNPEIYAVCQMNLLLHGVEHANITNGDTLDYPRFRENGRLKPFNIIIANPPWNQDGYSEDRLKKADFRERFSFGYPPKDKADWAWVQHMLACTGDDGRVGVVIDKGCLFRGAREKAIRSQIIEKDLIESVILLPAKLFYNTGAPGVIIIFNKKKPAGRNKKIFFINASYEFVSHPFVRRLNSLSNGNIKKIADASKGFSNLSGFCKIVDIKEIRENDYNLNVTLYVMPIQKGEQINIPVEFSDLQELENKRQEVREKLEGLMEDLLTKGGGHNEFKYSKDLGYEVPKDWEVLRLRDLVDSEDGIVAGPFGSNLKVSDYRSTGVPIIRLQNIEKNRFVDKDMKYISPEKAEELKYHSFRAGDIILAKLGDPIGKTCIVPDFVKTGIVVADVVRIRPSPKKAVTRFLEYLLNSSICFNQLRRETIGSTRPRVNISQVRNLKLPLPPLSEQEKIASILSTVDETLETERNEQLKMQKIKKGLMDSLLLGKLGLR